MYNEISDIYKNHLEDYNFPEEMKEVINKIENDSITIFWSKKWKDCAINKIIDYEKNKDLQIQKSNKNKNNINKIYEFESKKSDHHDSTMDKKLNKKHNIYYNELGEMIVE